MDYDEIPDETFYDEIPYDETFYLGNPYEFYHDVFLHHKIIIIIGFVFGKWKYRKITPTVKIF